MDLPESSVLWVSTILMSITTISILLLIQHFRNGDIAKANVQTPKAQVSATRSVSYRLRGIPSSLEQRDVKELVKEVLALEDDITVDINSLANDPSRYGEKIATLDFSKTPRSLSKPTDNSEWRFSTYNHQSNDRGKSTLLFDTHFRGLTPLHSSSDAECTIDLIAVSGLGSHAFGSFKERKGPHMWLRDSLAHDIPNMRILIYGYTTQMDGSASFANLDDLANEFQERIKNVRSYPRLKRSEIPSTNPERPLILIGHSLGGIIIKAALVRMSDGDVSDKANFKSVSGMLFFGVPNQGIPINQWIPIVDGQPNRSFIEQLCASSDILRVFRKDFRKIFTFRDSKIYSFYETKESPTARRGSNEKWELTGPCIKLVDTASATHGRSWEEGGIYIKPIHRTHSDLVKFSPIDDNYTTVSNCLFEFADTARLTIMRRFLSPQEILQLFVESISVDQVLQILQSVNQMQHKSTRQAMDCGRPEFSWIFRNLDFQHWNTASHSRILWLSGPPECNMHNASLYILNENLQKSQRTILYYYFSSIASENSIVSQFVLALLCRFVRHSPKDKQKSIVGNFLRALVKGSNEEEKAFYTNLDLFRTSPEKWLQKVLSTPADTLWTAIVAVLSNDPERKLLIIIDGLERVEDETEEFIKSIRAFVDQLQHRVLDWKVLLTSGYLTDINKVVLDGLPNIEFDKERRECRASLYFENSRYGKILKEHDGSLEWIWTHNQYKEWSKSDASQFLYLQGKPGSGKSTLTRYYRENLSKRDPDAKSAVVARFFYSERGGELQRSHYNMLRCILYEILGQHEALFYRYFQSEYRDRKALREQGCKGPVEWDYESLKRIFSSISDFSPVKRLYLIIDAVDESNDDNRREILNLLFDICSKPKDWTLKIFLASRPIGILQRNNAHEIFKGRFLSIILQDQTKADIARFADSFLKYLEFSDFLKQATEYIVQNAQGVFLWVQLVKKELLAYDEAGRCTEKDIFEFLKSLPTELEELYQSMLSKMGRNRADIQDG